MSLPWSKPAKLAVAPQQITAFMARRGQDGIEIITPVSKSEGDAGPYQCVGSAIQETLRRLSEKLGAPMYGSRRLDVEVADIYVYYDVLQLDARRLPAAELERMAAVGLADSLGLEPASLATRCSVQADGQSVVVCGMPSALLAAIGQAIAEARYRLHKLEPGFVTFWNAHCSQHRNGDALLMCVREGVLTLGWLQKGKWQALATERASGNDWAGLHDSCDAFCRRMCVPDHASLPVLFDADIDDIPEEARGRWQHLAKPAFGASELAPAPE